ncbi:MAG: hypothetical protein WEE50_05330 [Chloroflexota bacterium]
MTTISSWTVPIVGFVLGILIALSLLGRDATPVQAGIAFAISAGYALVLRALQSRSDVASLLSGMPRDERWDWINLRALSLSAQVIAIAIVGAFLVAQFNGADATPYAWLGALFGATYLAGIVWYRQRS